MRESEENRYRFVIVAILCLARFGSSLIMSAPAALLPLIMRDFAISRGTVSWFFTVPALLFVLFSVPSGILVSKIGLRKAFAIGTFLQAASILMPLSFNFPMLFSTRVLFGMGMAMSMPLSAGIIAQWFSRKDLPVANSFGMVSGSVGSTLAFFITVPIAAVLSWRGTLTAYGALPLIVAFLWLILGRENPAARGSTTSPERHPSQSTSAEEVPPTVWQVLRRRETLLLGGSLMGVFCLMMSLISWLPTYYHEVFKMPLAKASAVSAIFMLSGIPASILGGILPTRFGLRKPLIVISGLMVGIMGLMTFLINNQVIIFTALFIYGIFGVIFMPVVFTIPMELPRMTPQTGSIMLAISLGVGGIGGFIGPVIVGYLADFTGSYLPGLLTTCVLSLSLFFGGLLLPETGPRIRKSLKEAPIKELA